jgi:hypothetical protein
MNRQELYEKLKDLNIITNRNTINSNLLSAYKTRKNHIKEKFKPLIPYLMDHTSFLDDNFNIVARINAIIKDIYEAPKCGYCSAPLYKLHSQYCGPSCSRKKSANVDQIVKDLKDNNKIILLEQFKGLKIPQQLKCLVCDHEWKAAPGIKVAMFYKKEFRGCPKCQKTNVKRNARDLFLTKLNQTKMRVVDHYPDNIFPMKKKVLFKNIECGHHFKIQPQNALRSSGCKVCGVAQRATQLHDHNVKTRYEPLYERWDEWRAYKSAVSKESEKSYKRFKDRINPNDHPRGLAGVEGAYQLDHIAPVSWCFEAGIPARICGHHTNLQILSWEENLTKSYKFIPDIICEKILDYL